ncbi:UvrD-helicase domain-containing protein [Paucidesulfovibrio longus]|uniref:UvrD-helicase domain-containing protein n=1 Tax=Paucidesulfovibrio longus TaxID=889 RepID=UPI0003B575FD|nr:UvrD-helicase domain-containing protein [Paucidesulfovibrio longus]
MSSELKQLKASAGSGKTFSLTRRFLDLLGGANETEPGYVCRRAAPAGHSWPEILAVTFTNKAAAEMKERVVGSLKRTALDLQDGQRADWSPRRAQEMLERILRRYQQLNIRTIDSLLNLLLRMFALDAGVPPDFELVFEDEELFDAVLERFQAACLEEGSQERELLEKALETLLRQEQSEGFWVADKIRERLRKIMRHLRASEGGFCTDQNELAELLTKSHGSFQRAAEAVERRVESKKLQCSKNFQNFLGKCRSTQLFHEPPSSAYASKESLADGMLKASKPLVAEEDDILYFRLKETLARYQRENAIIGGAYKLAPCVLLAERLAGELERIERDRGQILGLGLPRMVRRQLEEGGGAPDAFCRLGGRLHHLLVDEFQDTSRDQWAAVTPLAEECLAKGGSLFYVGDIKQAIYGWRGGDASLFDEIRVQPGLAEVAEINEADLLPHNWRSLDRVVAFNNFFFTRLADEDLNAMLAARCLGRDAEAENVAALARALSGEFRDAHQSMPVNADTGEMEARKRGGYVRVERLPGADDREELEQQALEAMTQRLLKNVRPRRPWGDVAVLVRSHAHAALVCDRLVAAGVPVITENSLQLDRHPVVRQLVALLNFLERPDDALSLAEFLLGAELRPEGIGPSPEAMQEWLAGLSGEAVRLPLWKALRRAFPDFWQDQIQPFARKSGLLTPYDLVAEMLSFFRVLERAPGAELYVRRFQEVVHRAGERGMGSLSAFLDFWKQSSGEEKVPLPENVDAVRIMTIHKSKGLEYPVVFAPFLYWPWPASPDLAEVDLYGRRMLTRMIAALGPEYQAELRRRTLEDLHLLYVTWTRAREELYAYFPQERPRQKSPATDAIELAVALPEDTDIFEYGTEPDAAAERAEPTQRPPDAEGQDVAEPGGSASPEAAPGKDIPPADNPDNGAVGGDADERPPSWQARLRVYRHMEREVADLSARLRGDVAHKTMELLRLHDRDDETTLALAARHAAEEAQFQFPILAAVPPEEREALLKDVREMALWALSRPELRTALAEGLREPDMVAAGDGEDATRIKRPDLVHFGAAETVVLEFKTGQRDPAHAIQLAAYLEMLAAWEPQVPVRGLLVYLDLRETEAVTRSAPRGGHQHAE